MSEQHVTKIETEPAGLHRAVCVCGSKSIWFERRTDAVRAGDSHRANKKVQALDTMSESPTVQWLNAAITGLEVLELRLHRIEGGKHADALKALNADLHAKLVHYRTALEGVYELERLLQ